MGVFARDGVWWIDYRVEGRRRREKIGKDRRLAQTVLAKRKVEIAENRYLDRREIPQTTFTQMANVYMEWSRANKRSARRDATSLRALKRSFRSRRLEDISTEQIERYKAARLKQVSPASVNRELACLKHLYSKAQEWKRAISNPARRVKLLREDNCRLRYLTHEEEDALVSASADYLKPLVRLAANTGLRVGEVLDLCWQNVDLDNGLLLVARSKSGKRREIPLNDTALALLRNVPRHIRSKFVFCKPDGSQRRTVHEAFKGARRRAGLEDDVVFHTLRHTFCSRLVMAGVDLVTVKELLGHSSLAMVLRYAHLSPGHRLDAVRKLDRASEGARSENVTAG